MNGYVKINRKITEWEWYDDPNTRAVFLHLIFTANWEDKEWRGITIRRGQRVISYRKFAKEVGISERELRTALGHLQTTHEVTQRATHHCTIITVENYDKYQCRENTNDTPSDTPIVTPTTTNEEYKNKELKRETPYGGKERKPSLSGKGVPSLDQIREYCKEINSVVDPDEFYDYYSARGWKMRNGVKLVDWKAAVRSWDRSRRNQDAEGDKEQHGQVLAKQQERLEKLLEYKDRLISQGASQEDLETIELNIMVVQEAINKMMEESA